MPVARNRRRLSEPGKFLQPPRQRSPGIPQHAPRTAGSRCPPRSSRRRPPVTESATKMKVMTFCHRPLSSCHVWFAPAGGPSSGLRGTEASNLPSFGRPRCFSPPPAGARYPVSTRNSTKSTVPSPSTTAKTTNDERVPRSAYAPCPDRSLPEATLLLQGQLCSERAMGCHKQAKSIDPIHPCIHWTHRQRAPCSCQRSIHGVAKSSLFLHIVLNKHTASAAVLFSVHVQ